jgi:hypothetical protein
MTIKSKMMKGIKRQCIFLILLSYSLLITAQIQIGSDIIGPVSEDNYGEQVKMSLNGNIVAVLGNDNASDGSVRVFENNGGNWVLYGTDSEGDNFGSISASSISLSYDGNTIAIGGSGLARVFTYESGTWTQKGMDIENSTSSSSFGSRISISSDGNTVAVSAPQFNPRYSATKNPPPIYHGLVQIFKYEADNWNRIGDNIEGESMDSSGKEISLSADGNTIAISSITTLRVYENISDVWTIKGNEIIEENSNPARISLSDDGTTIAIGDPDYSDTITTRGRTKIYKFEIDEWIQIGNAILGEDSFSRSGRSLSISPNGQVLINGAVGHISGVPSPGRVRVFIFQDNSWVQIGIGILGDEVGDHFGDSVSISADANTLAIGAQYADINGFESGYVRIYDLSTLLSIDDIVQPKIRLFPNPAREQFTIQLYEGMELKKVNIYNSLGVLVNSISKNVISTSKLSTGIYYVEIYTTQGKTIKKLVIK